MDKRTVIPIVVSFVYVALMTFIIPAALGLHIPFG